MHGTLERYRRFPSRKNISIGNVLTVTFGALALMAPKADVFRPAQLLAKPQPVATKTKPQPVVRAFPQPEPAFPYPMKARIGPPPPMWLGPQR